MTIPTHPFADWTPSPRRTAHRWRGRRGWRSSGWSASAPAWSPSSLWYWLRRRRNGPGPEDRYTLLALATAGPLAFLANELGWLVSEFGRQPWVVYGVFRTSNAITTASGLGATFAGFTLLYVG